MELERRDFLKLAAGALVLRGTPQEYQTALGTTATQVFPISPGDTLSF
ncbi:MAG TPA: hypothetical protein VK746_21335 [Candidatus Eisenbacteria bacterium]|jgi:hypothetical protein|nr:hypothetical protein [Candidatus Eisenbacteria bacterium]